MIFCNNRRKVAIPMLAAKGKLILFSSSLYLVFINFLTYPNVITGVIIDGTTTATDVPIIPHLLVRGYIIIIRIHNLINCIFVAKSGLPYALNIGPVVAPIALIIPQIASICSGAIILIHSLPRKRDTKSGAKMIIRVDTGIQIAPVICNI